MNILLVCVLFSLSILACGGSPCEDDGKHTIVNAGDYELKFDAIFQQYWLNNRTITSQLRNIVQVPKQPNLKIEELPDSRNPTACLMCRAFSFSLLNYYRNNSDQNVDEYLFDLCTILLKEQDYGCRGIINIYLSSVTYILEHRKQDLSSDRICGIMFQNYECSTTKNLIDFEIESHHEPVLRGAKKYLFDERTMNSSSFFSIAHLSDFHYDPHYAVGSSSDCVDFICCRNTSTPKVNSTHTAGYWGDYYSCDSPGYLVENICSQVATNHKNIDIIYYTGDFVDHFGWLTTKSSVMHSLEFITEQIKGKFPNVPVVMVIGNHDIHPSDAFAPNGTAADVSSTWLYEYAAGLWSDWLPQSALSTLRTGGYYSFVFRPGFRIIVLNNNLCFVHNIWLLFGADEMIAQLQWLRDTLVAAERSGEKVHILGHVPPNTSSCIRAWNREYNRLIRQFAHLISGQFNGHTHNDELTLYYSTDEVPVAVNVAWTGGSGTSFVGLNSNYRLYTAELNTFEVVDQETYIFNLTEANLTPGRPPRWFKEYSLREAFGLTDLSPFTLSKLINGTFRHDRRALHKFWTYKNKMADPQLAKGYDDDCLEKLRLITNGDIENDFF